MLEVKFNAPFLKRSNSKEGFFGKVGHDHELVRKYNVVNIKI